MVSWAPGRLLGLGSPILPAAGADASERHGVSQLTVQDRDVPGPLKSQGKVHVPIPGEAPPEPRLSRSRPCCPPGAQMRRTGSDDRLSTGGVIPSLTVPLRAAIDGDQREQSQVSSGFKIGRDVSYECRDTSLHPESLFYLKRGARTASSHPSPALRPEDPA